ncbi:MAG: hypothetical protein ACREMK_15035 [Gemmatimonadota bacterium]
MRGINLLLGAMFLAGILAAVGCTDGTTAPPPGTGLEILVLKGPIEPVEREGVENTAPVAEAVLVIRSFGGRRVAELTTNADGRTRAPLAPGRYTVVVERCPGALFLPEPATATVDIGVFAGVRLECDTGIR